jgi:hypothetical protein
MIDSTVSCVFSKYLLDEHMTLGFDFRKWMTIHMAPLAMTTSYTLMDYIVMVLPLFVESSSAIWIREAC